MARASRYILAQEAETMDVWTQALEDQDGVDVTNAAKKSILNTRDLRATVNELELRITRLKTLLPSRR